jgi:hypothetical protein
VKEFEMTGSNNVTFSKVKLPDFSESDVKTNLESFFGEKVKSNTSSRTYSGTAFLVDRKTDGSEIAREKMMVQFDIDRLSLSNPPSGKNVQLLGKASS